MPEEKTPFIIWVDADACPRAVRDIIELAALRRHVQTVFVANTYIHLHESEYLRFQFVPAGPDKADDHIVDNAAPTDLAITADIPLADRLVKNGVHVIDPRGEELTEATIGERLAMRNLLEDLRGAGLVGGGPREMDNTDVRQFANAFDRYLTKRMKT